MKISDYVYIIELNKTVLPFPDFSKNRRPNIENHKLQIEQTLDVNSAFRSITVHRSKAGFVTKRGHFQWICSPYDLKP